MFWLNIKSKLYWIISHAFRVRPECMLSVAQQEYSMSFSLCFNKIGGRREDMAGLLTLLVLHSCVNVFYTCHTTVMRVKVVFTNKVRLWQWVWNVDVGFLTSHELWLGKDQHAPVSVLRRTYLTSDVRMTHFSRCSSFDKDFTPHKIQAMNSSKN